MKSFSFNKSRFFQEHHFVVKKSSKESEIVGLLSKGVYYFQHGGTSYKN